MKKQDGKIFVYDKSSDYFWGCFDDLREAQFYIYNCVRSDWECKDIDRFIDVFNDLFYVYDIENEIKEQVRFFKDKEKTTLRIDYFIDNKDFFDNIESEIEPIKFNDTYNGIEAKKEVESILQDIFIL